MNCCSTRAVRRSRSGAGTWETTRPADKWNKWRDCPVRLLKGAAR